ncbi:TIR domain-containing protein [Taibaiella lutea]|uniref:TIR domain-containing protein n=1 Tax=Taibaiella lutea TaxID=2608001 RepID=A0A5M6CBC9_9BACT|nr:toll/interleukin-1 receptor domain-containing protein [Taibaiella lutea]KAA5532486.1 TIR domain-containing protein [Taibaiella lutea]
MLHDVFISYTQPDRNVAFFIHDLLQENKLTSWIAPSQSNGIKKGLFFESQVVNAIINSKVFVLIYSDYCNRSNDIIREIRHRNNGHKTIILRLDKSGFCTDLSYYLKNIQYIVVTRNGLRQAANILLQDVMMLTGRYTEPENGTTDGLLLRKGIELVEAKRYEEAIKVLEQHSGTVTDSCETMFYLSLALIGGKKIRKLDRLLIRRLENILLPEIFNNENTGFINVLLAIIKQAYYMENGFTVPEPGIEQLISGIALSAEKTKELLIHLNKSESKIWQQVLIKDKM